VSRAPDLNDAVEAFRRGDLDRARAAAKRAVESAPSPDWHHLLGLIHCRLGNPADGVEHLRAAAVAEPANASFQVMLARALIDAGRPNEVLAMPVWSGNSPPELALWHARAEAAEAAGDRDSALPAWQKLCEAGVSNWRVWDSYGQALATAERWDDSAKALEQAVALNPSELAVRQRFGAALSRAGRYDESVAQFRRCVEIAPDDVAARIFLARLLADRGDQEWPEHLDRAARLATGQGLAESDEGLIEIAKARDEVEFPVLLDLARLLERAGRMDALRRLLADSEALGIPRERLAYPAAAVALADGDAATAKRLLENGKEASNSPRWHWLMARIEDSLGNSDAAFAQAEVMNESVSDRDEWLAKGSKLLATVRSAAAAMTPQSAAALRPLEPAVRRSPVFLVGFPRSGTTLLDTFLMGHPDVTVLEEVLMVNEAQDALGGRRDLSERSRPDLERARDAYFAALDRETGADHERLVIDKVPLNMLAAGFIHAIFPDAAFVFAQRHPCDCVLSCFMQAFTLNDAMACFLTLEGAAAFYDSAMTLWTRSADLLRLNAHTIVYETLVADPEAQLRPLVDFLGLDWHGELLDHRSTAKARGTINTPSYSQVTQPLTRTASGRWKRYEKQLEPVLPILIPWAERLGYAD